MYLLWYYVKDAFPRVLYEKNIQCKNVLFFQMNSLRVGCGAQQRTVVDINLTTTTISICLKLRLSRREAGEVRVGMRYKANNFLHELLFNTLVWRTDLLFYCGVGADGPRRQLPGTPRVVTAGILKIIMYRPAEKNDYSFYD